MVSKPVRVLHVFGRLDIGGAESLIMDIYRNIDRDKVQFDFAVHTKDIGHFEKEITELGGHVYHDIPPYRLYNYVSYKRAWGRFFSKHPQEIVHIHTTNPAVPILREAIKHGINARILHAHNTGEAGAARRLHVRLARPSLRRRGSLLLAVSDMAGRFIFGYGYIIRPNAIQAVKFRFDPVLREKVRRDMGWENDFIVCHVGRFHSQKNHVFLLRVFKELADVIPAARLVLLGDGELRPEIEKKLSEPGFPKDRVSLLGARDDVPELLQGADVFVLPSLYEGLPVSVVEAQAAGLPCFLSDTITKEACITDGLAQFLPIGENIRGWVRAIRSVSEERPQRRDTYQEICAAGFDMNETARWYEEFYMSERRKAHGT